MAPTGQGVPGIWKQSGVIWAIKDMMHYAVAVKFLQQCQESDAVPGSGARAQEISWAQLMVLCTNLQTGPSCWTELVHRGFENTLES